MKDTIIVILNGVKIFCLALVIFNLYNGYFANTFSLPFLEIHHSIILSVFYLFVISKESSPVKVLFHEVDFKAEIKMILEDICRFIFCSVFVFAVMTMKGIF